MNGAPEDFTQKQSISWHTVATSLMGLTMFVGGLIISSWRTDFATMQEEMKEVKGELQRQNGVDIAIRQQVDINTAHLARIDVDRHDMERVVNRIDATIEFWRETYKWRSPLEKR